MKRLLAILTLVAAPAIGHAADIYQFLGTLTIQGLIKSGDFDKVRDTLDAKTFQVFVRSPGGNALEARRIGDLLASRDLPVVVRGYCESACATDIFLVARRRVINDGGFVAFHGGDVAIGLEIAQLARDYAAAHPDDTEFARGTQTWKAHADALEAAVSGGWLADYADMTRRVGALTTPVIESVTYDRAANSLHLGPQRRAVCDWWVPRKAFLAEIGVDVRWKGDDASLEDIARKMRVAPDRIYQGSILQVDPAAPAAAGCRGGSEPMAIAPPPKDL